MKYIFVHGLGQNASSWDKTKECLADKLEMVIPELSEFIRQGNCTYSKIYSSFCEYCNDFSEPVHLCGLSLGAVLALNYAIDFPQKAGSLVLIAPQYDMPKFMPESQFKDIGFYKKDFITLTKSMEDMDFTKRLDRVKCPVLVMCGEKDKVNKKAAINLTGKLTNAKFITIEHSGHEVNMDNPEGLAKAIEMDGDIYAKYINDWKDK